VSVQRGQAWGRSGPVPADLVSVGSDAELHRLVDTHRRAGRPLPAVRLTGGDLWRSCGGSPDRPVAVPRPGDVVAWLPVDVVHVTLDGSEHWAAAHVIARRGWWSGPVLAIMSAEHLGRWDVAPKAHPGDGRVDVVSVAASMSRRQRWAARQRLATGTHLPHPDIGLRRMAEGEWSFERAVRVWVDGVGVGRTGRLRAVVEPDALTVCV
jgi:hypothetical protein